MPWRLLLSLLLAGAVASCAGNSPVVSLARKEALRKILVPEFAVTSIPAKREEDFFRVLDVFDAGRRKNEFVRSVEFKFGSEATLGFEDGGMHGGGVAILKMKGGKWIIDQKAYIL
jgi:hypothetical protein